MKRFWDKVKKTRNCWEWQGAIRGSWGPYGNFGFNGKTMLAHRMAYILCIGPIPEGMCVLHSCDNPKCVRPAHLFLGTPLDNVHDRNKKGRTARGIKNGKAKLTPDKATQIRILTHTLTAKQVAKMFGVAVPTVYDVMYGKNWTW